MRNKRARELKRKCGDKLNYRDIKRLYISLNKTNRKKLLKEMEGKE